MDFVARLILVVVSDLFEGEFMEDAFLMGEAFYVIAESPDGRRWRHERTFSGEGAARRAFAGEQAERLRATIEQAIDHGNWKGPKGNAHWLRFGPAMALRPTPRAGGPTRLLMTLLRGISIRLSVRMN